MKFNNSLQKGLLAFLITTLTFVACDRNITIVEESTQKPTFNSLVKSDITSSSISVDVSAIIPDGFSIDESGWILGTDADINIDENLQVIKNADKNKFKVSVNNLKPQTDYFLKAYVKRGTDFFYSLSLMVTTEILLEWKQPDYVPLSPNSVLLLIEIKNSEATASSITKMGFRYQKGSQLGSSPTEIEITPVSIGTNYTLKNLESDTEYAVQYFLENYDGTILSDLLILKTIKSEEEISEDEPTPDPEDEIVLANVKTNQPEQVSGKIYSLSGTLENTGNDPETTVGIEISRTANFNTLVDNLPITLGSSNDFSKEYGFSEFSTTYYIRAYAQNKAGRSEGLTFQIVTPDESSDFASINAIDKGGRVYELTAILAKDISLTKTGFYISKNANPKTGGVFIAGAKTKTFTGITSALEAGTKYYYQAIAENASGEILSQIGTINVPAIPLLEESTLVYTDGSFRMTGKIKNAQTSKIDEYGFFLMINGETEFKLKISNINSDGLFTNSIQIPYGEVKAKSYLVVDGQQKVGAQKTVVQKPDLLVWESAVALLNDKNILMEATFNHVRKRQVQETGFYMSTDISKVGSANNTDGRGGFSGQKFKGNGTIEKVRNGVSTQFFDFNGAPFEAGKVYFIRPYAKVFDVEYSTKGAPITLQIPLAPDPFVRKPEITYTNGSFTLKSKVFNRDNVLTQSYGFLYTLNGVIEKRLIATPNSNDEFSASVSVPYGVMEAKAFVDIDGFAFSASETLIQKPSTIEWKNFFATLNNGSIEMSATANYIIKSRVEDVGFYISTNINAVGGSNNSDGLGGFGNATKVDGGATVDLETDGVPRQFFDVSTNRIDKGKIYYVRPFIKVFGTEYSTTGTPIKVEVPADQNVTPATKGELIAEVEKAIREKGNNVDLNYINTSLVTDMSSLFKGKVNFNGDITQWDVSNVVNMSRMFEEAKSFNRNLNGWNVGKVKDFSFMFYRASTYNQPMSSWNMESAETLRSMFNETERFNQPINNWNVSKVKDMRFTFHKANSFNQPLDQWNVSNVTIMDSMFRRNTAFNQNLDGWGVSPFVSKKQLFEEATGIKTLPFWYHQPPCSACTNILVIVVASDFQSVKLLFSDGTPPNIRGNKWSVYIENPFTGENRWINSEVISENNGEINLKLNTELNGNFVIGDDIPPRYTFKSNSLLICETLVVEYEYDDLTDEIISGGRSGGSTCEN